MMLETLTNKVNESLKGSILEPKSFGNVNTTERLLSIAGGTFLLYKALKQVFRHPLIGLQEAAVSGVLLYRGATGFCPVYDRIGKDSTDLQSISITERFIVDRPREEVYSFWRNLENLPRFMKHLHSVIEMDGKNSKWSANIPHDLLKISWNAEITREEQNSYIGWQSVEGSLIDNAGKVEFADAKNGLGTELNIEINYFPPAGNIGRGIAKLLNGIFEKMVREDVTNFKHYVEGQEYQTYISSSQINS
ncbi:SRPBCC family protein [Pedobacter sp. P351]|uniref:SRPBCC family protein n=1 Tax=Pedobacter superstes TaxID=3133441 RepID=UPI0030B0F1DB